MISKENLRARWQSAADNPRSQRIQKIIRRVVIVAIVGMIVYQLSRIGWGEVLRNLPTNPLFYILFVVIFLVNPIGEIFIYRQIWPIQRWEMFKTFLTKRVYNEEVMGYSGEVFLFSWARKLLDSGDREILKNIRDNNILSAVSSYLVAFTLVGILVFFGVIDLESLLGDVSLAYIIGGVLITIALVIVVVQFRRYVFALPFSKAITILGIYLSRFTIYHGLMIVQWAVVIPETPLRVWLLFAAIIIAVNRIPFLPSRDLIFVWAGIELSRSLDMATAAVAGMLLVNSALRKIANLVLFLVISTSNKGSSEERPDNENESLG